MNKLKIFMSLLLGLGFFTMPTFSQSDSPSSVSGHVVEFLTNEPLEYVNVALYRTGDSIPTKGVTTNKEGVFKIIDVPTGQFYVEISFVGYQSKKSKKFLVESSTHQVELGKFGIELNAFLLDEVEIEAKKSTYNYSISKKIYNVEQDLMSQTSSVTEILNNLPSVSLDVNGQVSLRGTSNISYLINGRPSALLRANSAAALQQIPASSIERIEVITNPSAKYRADGVGGIINIVMKEKALDGLNVTLQGNVGNLNRQNANLTFNYNLGDVNFFATYGFKNSKTPQNIFDTRIDRDGFGGQVTRFDNHSIASFDQFSHIVNGGLNIKIGENSSLEIAGEYFYGKNDNNSLTDWFIQEPEEVSELTIDRIYDGFEEEFEIGGAFEHEFEEDHTLAIEFTYGGYNEREDNDYAEAYTFYDKNYQPSFSNSKTRNLIEKGGPLAEIAIEYAVPIGDETELEAGYLYQYVQDDIQTLWEEHNDNVWLKNPNRTYQFKFDQQIHGAFLLLGQGFGNFSATAGLRAEQALVTSRLITTNQKIPNNYFRLYPSLNLTYELNSQSEIQLNYSKRVNRADPDEQNPFPEYDDPRTRDAGNPLLKPEMVHSVELGYHLRSENFSFIPSLFYRYKYDAFTELREIQEDSILHTSFINFDTDQSAGLELIFRGKLSDRFQYNYSATGYYNQIEATNLGFVGKKSNFSFETKLATNISITKSTYAQLNAHLISPRLTPQGEFRSLFLLNMGIRQDILKKRASVILTISDVFASLEWESRIDTPNLFWNTRYARNQQIFYVGLSYNFKQTGKRDRSNLNFEDEIEESNLPVQEEDEEE